MDVNDALVAFVNANSGIVATLGSNGQGTVSAASGLAPEESADTLPSLTWLEAQSWDPAPTHDGPSGLLIGRYQFKVRAASIEEARLTSTAFIRALHGFKGKVNGFDLGPCFLLRSGMREQFDADQNVFLTNFEFEIGSAF